MKSLKFLFIGLAAGTLAVTTQAAKLPEKIRVLSCDLAAAEGNKVSPELKALLDKADPDVVFLQHVTDWEACDQICKLKPGLRVLTCSSFSNGRGEVAILGRDKAMLSWSDSITKDNGFAFAVIQAGARKFGVFSVQTADASATSADRMVAEVKRLQQFANNRPETFLIAGAPLANGPLAENGFETISADAGGGAKKAGQFWTFNAGFICRPRALNVVGLSVPAVVTDIDTANTFATKFAYQNVLLFAGEIPAPVQAVLAPSVTAPKASPAPWIIGGSLAALLLIALLFGRRKTSMAVVLAEPAGVGPADQLSEPTRQNLVAWLKTIFVQRLIADRRKMMADENEATRRTLAIEQKLSELQVSLQDRISAYEHRIARLESELSAATFENRELIRLQISDLKEKVAKAKEEFVVRRN
jgi:hypothetical protein